MTSAEILNARADSERRLANRRRARYANEKPPLRPALAVRIEAELLVRHHHLLLVGRGEEVVDYFVGHLVDVLSLVILQMLNLVEAAAFLYLLANVVGALIGLLQNVVEAIENDLKSERTSTGAKQHAISKTNLDNLRVSNAEQRTEWRYNAVFDHDENVLRLTCKASELRRRLCNKAQTP